MYQKYVDAVSFTQKRRLLLIPVLVAVLIFVMPGIFQMLYSTIFPAPLTEVGSMPMMLGMGTTVIVAIILMTKVSKLKVRDLGLYPEGALKQFLIGDIGGILLLSLVALIIWLLGAIQITQNMNAAPSALFVGLLFFLFQGTWEEVIYRSYLMPHFSKVMGDKWSIIITSIMFTAFHGMNPGMQPLPILNLFIGSLVFSLVYYYTGSLIIVGVGHGLWNYAQGFIFGAEVSGNSIANAMFKSATVPGKELISGGNFGFEGGLVTTVVGLVLIALFIQAIKKKQRA